MVERGVDTCGPVSGLSFRYCAAGPAAGGGHEASRLADRYMRQGSSSYAIGVITGLDRQSVTRILRQDGVPLRPRRDGRSRRGMPLASRLPSLALRPACSWPLRGHHLLPGDLVAAHRAGARRDHLAGPRRPGPVAHRRGCMRRQHLRAGGAPTLLFAALAWYHAAYDITGVHVRRQGTPVRSAAGQVAGPRVRQAPAGRMAASSTRASSGHVQS
jgi:hypothetical protein